MASSLYVHIPFCKRKCIYCNFYSRIYKESEASDYVDAILLQLSKLTGSFKTVYVGGGTPTALGLPLLKKLVQGLSRVSKDSIEFTFEANPESADRDRMKMLLDHGVNRISIGVQSIKDEKLKDLGRIHDVGKAIASVMDASKIGFDNISIDLIFGLCGEKPEKWKRELEEAVRLPAKHISCYELTYESGTPLFGMLENRAITPLDDDVVAGMYETAIEELALRDFKQYEVSNFAKPGFESQHNMNYWENSVYLGLGASAFSYDGQTRSRNVSDACEYVRLVLAGKNVTDFSERLPPERKAKETAAVKIRTREGIDFNWFKKKTGYDLEDLEKKAIPKLIDLGLIRYIRKGDAVTGINLKRKGFLFCDTVSSSLL
ncbi:MAG: radical SAM family heme chaperone HemW [Candidatus Omnitrophica bacterium]|nr:radical SAM family heme chaperone HemW [Candidatus Omnitrophota bacterium]